MPQAKPVGKPGQSRSYLAHASSTSLRLATPSLSATRCTYVNTLPVPPLLRRMRRHTSAPVFFSQRHIQHQRIRPGMRVMAMLDRHCGRTRAPALHKSPWKRPRSSRTSHPGRTDHCPIRAIRIDRAAAPVMLSCPMPLIVATVAAGQNLLSCDYLTRCCACGRERIELD